MAQGHVMKIFHCYNYSHELPSSLHLAANHTSHILRSWHWFSDTEQRWIHWDFHDCCSLFFLPFSPCNLSQSWRSLPGAAIALTTPTSVFGEYLGSISASCTFTPSRVVSLAVLPPRTPCSCKACPCSQVTTHLCGCVSVACWWLCAYTTFRDGHSASPVRARCLSGFSSANKGLLQPPPFFSMQREICQWHIANAPAEVVQTPLKQWIFIAAKN